jgi:hypothetical protein
MYTAMGLGFGVGTVITLDYYVKHGELPLTPFGFRSLSGPFEALAPDQFTALGWAFVGICAALDLVSGIWLWRGRRRGALLGLATSPAALLLGIGFALPFQLIGVPIRVALTWAGRGSLC